VWNTGLRSAFALAFAPAREDYALVAQVARSRYHFALTRFVPVD
jgi:hypothetical protein